MAPWTSSTQNNLTSADSPQSQFGHWHYYTHSVWNTGDVTPGIFMGGNSNDLTFHVTSSVFTASSFAFALEASVDNVHWYDMPDDAGAVRSPQYAGNSLTTHSSGYSKLKHAWIRFRFDGSLTPADLSANWMGVVIWQPALKP